MTLADLLKDILDSSKERIKTPITGAYFFTFIIYNWRSIALVMFSKKSIEEIISQVNKKYSGYDVVLFPLVLAIVYCIVVPYLMMIIDRILVEAKSGRESSKNELRIRQTKLKIKLADEELNLQDKLSRNKEKQDFLDKISQLEQQVVDNVASNKALTDNYKKQVADLSNALDSAHIERRKVPSEEHDFSVSEKNLVDLVLVSKFSDDEMKMIEKLPENTARFVNLESITDNIMKVLTETQMMEEHPENKGKFHLTNAGLAFRRYIRNKQHLG